MVPKGRRHATSDIWTIGEAALRAISVACGTRGACDSTRAMRGSAGDRPADGAVGVDDLAGAATQCRDAQRGLDYRATTAQWHADRAARRPKPVKLADNVE